MHTLDPLSALISTDALAGKPCGTFRIMDASWHMPSEQRIAYDEYRGSHIPGAVFFDIDRISDRTSPLPHMLPPVHEFEAAMGALGIGNDDEIIVYDSSGIFSAARAWWMFRVFGHHNIRVLNGGLPKWQAEGRKTETDMPDVRPRSFHATFKPELLRDRQAVAANIASRRELMLDARSPGRFLGTEPEPRPGLPGGHIQGSYNIFFKECLSPPYNTLKMPEELRAIFTAHGVKVEQPLAVTCGSGVTACILALALFELGNRNVPVYDGAWTEWASAKVKETPR